MGSSNDYTLTYKTVALSPPLTNRGTPGVRRDFLVHNTGEAAIGRNGFRRLILGNQLDAFGVRQPISCLWAADRKIARAWRETMPGRRSGLLALNGDQRGIIADAAVDDGDVDVDGVHPLERQGTGPSVDGLGLIGLRRRLPGGRRGSGPPSPAGCTGG